MVATIGGKFGDFVAFLGGVVTRAVEITEVVGSRLSSIVDATVGLFLDHWCIPKPSLAINTAM